MKICLPIIKTTKYMFYSLPQVVAWLVVVNFLIHRMTNMKYMDLQIFHTFNLNFLQLVVLWTCSIKYLINILSCPHSVPSWILWLCTYWGCVAPQCLLLGYLETPMLLCLDYASSPRTYPYFVLGYLWVTLLL